MAGTKPKTVEELEAEAEELTMAGSLLYQRAARSQDPAVRRKCNLAAQQKIRNAERVINAAIRAAMGGNGKTE